MKSRRHRELPFRRNRNRSALHIIVKLAKYKDKERILKAFKDKQALTYKGGHIRVVADPSTETWQARRERKEIFNVLNRKNMQLRIFYPASLSFRIGKIKVQGYKVPGYKIPDKQKLTEFITTNSALQAIPRGMM